MWWYIIPVQHVKVLVLTHLPLDKMAAISQTTYSTGSFWMMMLEFQFNFHWHVFLPKDAIDNKSALVQVTACRRFGVMSLPEPMLTQFTDAYMWHEGEMRWSKNERHNSRRAMFSIWNTTSVFPLLFSCIMQKCYIHRSISWRISLVQVWCCDQIKTLYTSGKWWWISKMIILLEKNLYLHKF